MEKNNIKSLWTEKKEYDKNSEKILLQAREWDSIARAILEISKETTELTADEMIAVDWAEKRLGVKNRGA